MGRTAVKERKPQTVAPAEVGSCRHHWLIESPSGALSRGRCKVCGEERQFRNSANDYIWDDDSSSPAYGRWSGVRSTVKLAEDDDMTAGPDTSAGEVVVAL